MLFSSPLFVFLVLPLTLLVYFAVRPPLKNVWLLVVSLLFYAWGEKLLVAVMLLTIVANWFFGGWIARSKRTGSGRGALAVAIAFDIGLLFVFKYADWLWGVFGQLMVVFHVWDAPPALLGSFLADDSDLRRVLFTPDGHVRLPIGVSFFTFQALSYVIDVWRGDIAEQKSLFHFAVYKSLFPQLIAGPIVRYKDVADQLVSRVVTSAGFAYGIRRFVVGLAKKMLIANIAAQCCDKIFDGVPLAELTPVLAWLATLCYTLQIYFDFSGYSDMAIGLGHMFGFKFLENFNYPYIAKSITEFWRRWHISLSTWFRDYLYIPLGGNRVSASRTYVNLLLVFFLCGLWHGASFNFVVWGLYHGFFLVLERAFLTRVLERTPGLVRHVYTLVVVMVGWVFFRSTTIEQALAILSAMFGFAGGDPVRWPLALYTDPLLVTAVCCGIVASVPWVARVLALRDKFERAGRAAPVIVLECAGLAAIALLFVASAIELAARSYNPFIYFRF